MQNESTEVVQSKQRIILQGEEKKKKPYNDINNCIKQFSLKGIAGIQPISFQLSNQSFCCCLRIASLIFRKCHCHFSPSVFMLASIMIGCLLLMSVSAGERNHSPFSSCLRLTSVKGDGSLRYSVAWKHVHSRSRAVQ